MQRYPADNPVQRFFRERTEDHLQQAVLMVRESDIPAESYAMANQFCRRALEALSPLPATEARRTLEELAQYILERRS